jgi:uncharacterized protein with GYD domain
MSEQTEKRRYMKNVKTDTLYAFDEKQIEKKLNMVECDKDKNLLIENISVASGEMVSVMGELVKEKAVLKEENLRLEKENLQYRAKYGSLESALPEAKGVAKAPAAPVVPEVKDEPVVPAPKVVAPEDLETTGTPTKAEMAKDLKDGYGIIVDPKKSTVEALQIKLAEAATMTPEQLKALELKDMLK